MNMNQTPTQPFFTGRPASIKMSRVLATVALNEPADPSRPAVHLRADAPANAAQALRRTAFGAHLGIRRTVRGDLYVWRESDPQIPDRRSLPKHYQPFPLLDVQTSPHICEVPDLPDSETKERIRAANDFPGNYVLLRKDAHPSLASYYRKKDGGRYDAVFRHTNAENGTGNLYVQVPHDPPHPLPIPTPAYFQEPTADVRYETAVPHLRPQDPDVLFLHLRKDTRRKHVPPALRPILTDPGTLARYVPLRAPECQKYLPFARRHALRLLLPEAPAPAVQAYVSAVQADYEQEIPPFRTATEQELANPPGPC